MPSGIAELEAPDRTAKFLSASVVAVRWLFGLQCLLSGLNWWFKILPFPNIFDPPGMPVKAEIVRTMIDSGWMFTAAKCLEILLGLSLLLNRFVPLMLVAAFPVIFMTFMLDANFVTAFIAWTNGAAPLHVVMVKIFDMLYFGGACIVMHVFLIVAYIEAYRPMFNSRAVPTNWSLR